MIKNKKAAWFPILLVVMTLTTLSYAAWVLDQKAKPFTDAIGERQFEIIKTYDEAEKHLLYIDQSSKFSSSQGIYEQALKGGYYRLPDCNRYKGFTIWRNTGEDADIECYPDQTLIKKSFKDYTNNYLNLYFNKYALIDIPEDNYDFLITGKTEILGFATTNLVLDILGKDEEIAGSYSVKPSFKTKIDFDLGVYEGIEEKAKQITSGCNVVSDVKACVKEEIKEINDAEELLSNGHVWSLDCESETEKAFYEMVYKFEECIKQEESNCICRSYSFSRFEDELKDYSIKLTQEDENTVIKLYKGKRFTGLKKTIKNKLNYFRNNDHNEKDYLSEFIIKDNLDNGKYSGFLEYKDEAAGQKIYLYIAKDADGNIGFLENPSFEPKTKSCFPEKVIVIDSNNYAYDESKSLVSSIKGKKGSAINLIDVATTDNNLLTLYTDGTEEGKINARIGALNKVKIEQGSIDLYIYLNGNEEDNNELLTTYYPYSDSEKIAKRLKSSLSKDTNLDSGTRVFPPESKSDLLISESSFLSPAIGLDYSFTRRDKPLLMDNILRSIKDYIPEEPDQTNFKICVNTGKKLVVYDEIEDKAEEKDITIRFAIASLEGIEEPEEPEEEPEELEEEPEEIKIENFLIIKDSDEECRNFAGYRYSVNGICESGQIGSLCKIDYECDKGKCITTNGNGKGFCGYETHDNCREYRIDNDNSCGCEGCDCDGKYFTGLVDINDETWFCNEEYEHIIPLMDSGAPVLFDSEHCKSKDVIEKKGSHPLELIYSTIVFDLRCK